MADFTHLHVHSEYSLLDGQSQLKKLIAATQAGGMNALALTDHGAMYGSLEFYKACQGRRRQADSGSGGVPGAFARREDRPL